MTESEWLTSTDPTPMLEFLRGKASDRKLRLFACGCSRYVWDSLSAERVRRAVEMAECYADGNVDDQQLSLAYSRACSACAAVCDRFYRRRITSGADVVRAEVLRMDFASNTAHVHKPYLIGRLKNVSRDSALRGISPTVLKDIFGNPFRPVTADPSWLTPTVTALAEAIYAEKAFDRLPILADALEEAGCDHADVLSHCRGEGPHVRGCWVVDLVLGKT